MRYEILNNGVVVNTIEADEAFVTAKHPGNFRLVAEPVESAQSIQRRAIRKELEEIDAQSDTPRMRREIRLDLPAGRVRLQQFDTQAIALRAQLAALG